VKIVYLDSNVFLKVFFEEEFGKETIERILNLARKNKARIAVSQWVINESVAAVQRKKKEGRITRQETSVILNGIADIIEGYLEPINLSLYPINEEVIVGSRTTLFETECPSAADALHVYVADKANCDYFVTADEELACALKRSHLARKLIAIHALTPNDLMVLFSDLE
jgi:predicted nucleic acid-binding protein